MRQFSALFNRPAMTWWDVVDILIVSLLIYEALKLIRGTRAMQMAIGSVVVILLLYASQVFPLRTVGWLIRSVLAYIVIAAIVLFQSDIRRALSHLGRGPFFKYLNLGQAEHAAETIEEVITASALLAKAKVGAIIVFEREIGLRNYVESGIPIDSTVSYDLLTNIFQPGTPLHDGAVIIAEGRLAAAACFLPLAVSPKLDRDLGTRHRAAIGLTEETDAIAVVISEERGEISIARHGQISRRLSIEELRDRLQTQILQRRRHPDQNAGGDGVDA
jgi:diadenylate cyclase